MASTAPSWRIFETDQLSKDLEALARAGRARLEAKLRETVYPQLRRQPFIGPQIKKLQAFQPETWRYRIGSWRFFYEIDEDKRIVFMIAAAHRGSAY